MRDVISASKATRAGGGVLHLPIRVLGARAPILILKSAPEVSLATQASRSCLAPSSIIHE